MQPHFGVAEAFLGLSEAARGNSDVSIPLLEKSFASHDRAVDQELKRLVGTRLGELYSDKGRLRDAETIYMWLLSNFPNDPQVLYQSFWVYMSIGRQVMNTLLREAPNSYRTHKLIGLLLSGKGNYAGAAEQFRQALKDNPAGAGLHYELGMLSLQSSDENGAAKEFEEELRLHPFHAPSYYQLAEGTARNGQLDRAWELYGKALQCNPTYPDALVGLCKVSLARNQPREALNYCQKATRVAPGNRPGHYLLVRIYRALGQTAEADAELAVFEKLQKESSTQLDFLTKVQIGEGGEH
jgi:tetratricopeptide (TPR) repeat protein